MSEGAASAAGYSVLRRGAATLAYRHVPGRGPGVFFCGGFMSDMNGSKALALDTWARTAGVAFTRFDYQGHGESSGRFVDGTIGVWADDAAAVFDEVATGPQIIVGSSMGGWIALLLALKRPERVAGLVGVAAAPDFTEDLMWDAFDESARRAIMEDGVWHLPSASGGDPEPITRALIEDGRNHLVLRSELPLTAPVRLLQGVQDREVPWRLSIRLMETLASSDVRLTLIKDGDHRLSREQDLALLCRTVGELVGAAE